MLYRLVSILLIATVISSNFTRFVIFASFKINQKYIAENLCVNRNKPWMHCDGKCYLMKKLKLAEQKEQQQEHQSQKNLLQETFFEKPSRVKFFSKLLQVFILPPQPVYSFTKTVLIFHPPKA